MNTRLEYSNIFSFGFIDIGTFEVTIISVVKFLITCLYVAFENLRTRILKNIHDVTTE